MAREQLLPLFPLQVVLFPGEPLPLHIFEPRYREMVGQAIEQKSDFGVILAEESEISSVGCTAWWSKSSSGMTTAGSIS